MPCTLNKLHVLSGYVTFPQQLMHPPHIPCYLIQWRNSPKGALLRWKGPGCPPQRWSLQEHAMTTNRARSTQGYKQVCTMSQQVSARSQASWQESSPPPSPHTTRTTPYPPHPKVTSRSVQGHNRSVQGHKHLDNRVSLESSPSLSPHTTRTTPPQGYKQVHTRS